jgi:hypothetical protein
MEITKTIQPGEMGSKQLFQQYGDRLVCVRYRIDHNLKRRYKTVELIIEEKPVMPRLQPMVWLKIGFNETELRQRIKDAGAKWIAGEKVWEMSYETSKRLKLQDRVIKRFQKVDGHI